LGYPSLLKVLSRKPAGQAGLARTGGRVKVTLSAGKVYFKLCPSYFRAVEPDFKKPGGRVAISGSGNQSDLVGQDWFNFMDHLTLVIAVNFHNRCPVAFNTGFQAVIPDSFGLGAANHPGCMAITLGMGQFTLEARVKGQVNFI
jgi:hypothetical protein